MARLPKYALRGFLPFMETNRELVYETVCFKDCHFIIDGSNLVHCLQEPMMGVYGGDFDDYADRVRDFFGCFHKANITLHIFFDGPAKGSEDKLDRSRQRRELRLASLKSLRENRSASDLYNLLSVSCQDIFRDVAIELDIQMTQVIGERDVTKDMVAYAKQINAPIISAGNKFYLFDFSSGYINFNHIKKEKNYGLQIRESGNVFQAKVYFFHKFAALVQPQAADVNAIRGAAYRPAARNDKVIPMFYAIASHDDLFRDLTKYFIGRKHGSPPFHFRPHYCGLNKPEKWAARYQILAYTLYLLTSRDEETALNDILSLYYRDKRAEIKEVFTVAEDDLQVEACDVMEQIKGDMHCIKYNKQVLPSWFVHLFSIEAKIVAGVVDTISDRYNYLMVLIEDLEQDSCHLASLRIRRLVYGIIFGDTHSHRIGDDADIFVDEMDRVGDRLELSKIKPLWTVIDPEEPGEPVPVPGLQDVGGLDRQQRVDCFILFLTGPVGFNEELKDCKKSRYPILLLKYWANKGHEIHQSHVVTMLLCALAVENRRGRVSNFFPWPVKLAKENSLEDYFIPQELLPESFSRLHPFAQLQSCVAYGKCLHRILMEPLGKNCDNMEQFMNCCFLHNISRDIESLEGEDGLEEFLDCHLELESRTNFKKVLKIIYNLDHIKMAEQQLD